MLTHRPLADQFLCMATVHTSTHAQSYHSQAAENILHPAGQLASVMENSIIDLDIAMTMNILPLSRFSPF